MRIANGRIYRDGIFLCTLEELTAAGRRLPPLPPAARLARLVDDRCIINTADTQLEGSEELRAALEGLQDDTDLEADLVVLREPPTPPAPPPYEPYDREILIEALTEKVTQDDLDRARQRLIDRRTDDAK